MLTSVKLTVLFNDPFWIGVFEIEDKNLYMVSKATFGCEPNDTEVYEFIIKYYYKLRFSKQESHENDRALKKVNPKRQQREIKRQLEKNVIGTKAQRALKEQHEITNVNRKKKTKEEKLAEERRKYEIKQAKRKENHKGH